MTSSNKTLDLFRLLQLASSNLPVGGYTFSQGLEYAIDAGWLKNVADIKSWIQQVSAVALVHCDLPLIKKQYQWHALKDWQSSNYWNQYALAIRETRELLLTDTAMGGALLRLAKGMDFELPAYCALARAQLSFVTVYSCIAANLGLKEDDACAAYCWTLIENQVLAASKLLPMGQTDAQNMLFELSQVAQDYVQQAAAIKDHAIGLSLPGLAMASAKHETQYSRLYRS